MKVIIISEHYFPIVGGTAFLTKYITEALARQNISVDLIVPSPVAVNEIVSSQNLIIHKVGLNTQYSIDLKKVQRLLFLQKCNRLIYELIAREKYDVVHVLSGIYSMNYLNIDSFRRKGLKAMATVINVPPQECGVTWEGDSLYKRAVDGIRKRLVKYVNRKRILAHNWDGYFAISECGKRLLSQYIDGDKIGVIPLGCHPSNRKVVKRNATASIKILTVAGYLPHKNYHLIPYVARELKKLNISFTWTFIGPIRIQRYYDYVIKKIEEFDIKDCINVIKEIPQEILYKYYEESDLYVQPSLEEGFCMSALDSILFCLPLIGIKGNSGSIEEFVKAGKGIMTENTANSLVRAIISIIRDPGLYEYSQADLDRIIEMYEWDNVVKGYIKAYNGNE